MTFDHPFLDVGPEPAPTHERVTGSRALVDVSRAHDVTPSALLSRDRSRRVMAARKDLCERLWRSGWSYPAIGRFVGRDHSSVYTLLNGKAGDHR